MAVASGVQARASGGKQADAPRGRLAFHLASFSFGPISNVICERHENDSVQG